MQYVLSPGSERWPYFNKAIGQYAGIAYFKKDSAGIDMPLDCLPDAAYPMPLRASISTSRKTTTVVDSRVLR